MNTNDFTDNFQNMSLDEIKQKFMEYSRAYQRMNKHGDPTIVNKRGRKTLSPEHKQQTYEKTLARKKEARREKARLEGRVVCVGRPVKNQPTQISV